VSYDARATAAALGGKRVLKREVRTGLDLHRAVAAGLPVESLARVVRAVTGPKAAPQAQKMTDAIVPEGTYKRRLKVGRLSRGESERTERLARVYALAEHVLGESELARAFLAVPHAELDGESPLDVLATEVGARQVEEILWAAYFGLPA
jgi:putative toxin-antitoxin system antitoxin component (TIGR02293 family)